MGQYGSASGGSLSASVESYALDAGQRVAAERDGLPKRGAAARDGAAAAAAAAARVGVLGLARVLSAERAVHLRDRAARAHLPD